MNTWTSSQKAPSAKRCIKTWCRCRRRSLRAWRVRKHRAPKGALRLRVQATQVKIVIVRKHRAPKGALRLVLLLQRFNGRRVGQKAPSAKRCIKTGKDCFSEDSVCADVRKHRAPKGALRPLAIVFVVTVAYSSQKAPSAKRCIKTALGITTCTPAPCQKAPSAKRCIKTDRCRRVQREACGVRKHRAPKGALRPVA